MSRDNVHEVRKFDPENMGQIEEFGLGFLVKMVCLCWRKESSWNSN